MPRYLSGLIAGGATFTLVLLLLPSPLVGSGVIESGRPGITYQHYVDRDEPWSIHVIRVERSRREYQLISTLGSGSRLGLATITQQIRRIPKDAGTAVVAINGDFFNRDSSEYAGDPRGLQIMRGDLVSGPVDRTCFWVDPQGNPSLGDVQPNFGVTWPNGEVTPFTLNEDRSHEATLYTPAVGRTTQTSGGVEFILEAVDTNQWLPLRPGEKTPAKIRQIRRTGNNRVEPNTMILSVARLRGGASAATEGDVVAISTETTPNLKGVFTAIGGGPALVHLSKVQPTRVSRSRERHPRSAVGWNKKHFLFVEVDGRQRNSRGMTLSEMADFMLQLGCEEAFNLDGGGSSEIWLDGKIMNSPCEGGERHTGNALVLVQKTAEARP